jgi:hypothetical protein
MTSVTPRYLLEERTIAAVNARLEARGIVPNAITPAAVPEGAAASALKQDDIPPPQENTEVVSDKNLPPELRVPESPYGYRLPAEPQHRAEVEQVGHWFRTAELPANLGRMVAQAAEQAAREPMTPEALKVATTKMHDNLRRTWGDSYKNNVNAVMALIDRVDEQRGGELWPWLNARPQIFTSAVLVKMLANHANRKRQK